MSFESESTLNSFLLGYLKNQVADLEESQLDLTPVSGFHSVRWILCHLAIAADMGVVLLGGEKQCPSAWHVAYGPGSSGVTHDKIKPTKGELLAKIDELNATLCSLANSADEAFLRQPHQLHLLKATPLQTQGDLISHLLTTHFATHIGQLSALRRQMGLPHLF
jgi:uncharacterized damage-inducible protein DinB